MKYEIYEIYYEIVTQSEKEKMSIFGFYYFTIFIEVPVKSLDPAQEYFLLFR